MADLKLTDESLMPYGDYKGEIMETLPAEYLLWLWDNDKCSAPVRLYIKDNLEDLRKDANFRH